ncbi:MAG: cyclic nucleotide-binding/CBS domain-containing protein [Bacteriovoracia bacterium]
MASAKYVRDLMISDVKTVDESETILSVVQTMAKQNIGAVIVVNQKKHPVGIFTERDLLKRVVAAKVSIDQPVAAAMTKELVCVQMHDELGELPQLMMNGKFRHLPVVDEFKIVGILSMRDMLRHLMP